MCNSCSKAYCSGNQSCTQCSRRANETGLVTNDTTPPKSWFAKTFSSDNVSSATDTANSILGIFRQLKNSGAEPSGYTAPPKDNTKTIMIVVGVALVIAVSIAVFVSKKKK